MKEKNRNLNSKGKIKLKTKGIREDEGFLSFFSILGVLITLFLLYWGILTILTSNVLGYLFLIPRIIISVLLITVRIVNLESRNTWYFFTENEAIKFIEKYLLFFSPKDHSINFDQIDCIINWGQSLEIVPLNRDGTRLLNGNEREFGHPPKGIKTIVLPLQGKIGDKIHQILFIYLKNHISLKPHPHIKYIYLNEK